MKNGTSMVLYCASCSLKHRNISAEKAPYRYRKIANCSTSRLVAPPRIFFNIYLLFFFCEKVDFCKSSSVYCSRIYSMTHFEVAFLFISIFTFTTNFIFFGSVTKRIIGLNLMIFVT